MSSQFLELTLAIVSGGVLQYIGQFIIAKRKVDDQNMETIIKTWSEDNKRLRAIENLNMEKIKKLEEQISLLRSQLIALESAHQDLPVPMWLKDLNGNMISLNRAYEKEFLIPRGYRMSDYVGKTDSAVWSMAVANEFKSHDYDALHSSEKQIFMISVPGEDNTEREWIVMKYKRYSANNIIGIAGLAIPKDLIK